MLRLSVKPRMMMMMSNYKDELEEEESDDEIDVITVPTIRMN
jgi:hypothetical protein